MPIPENNGRRIVVGSGKAYITLPGENERYVGDSTAFSISSESNVFTVQSGDGAIGRPLVSKISDISVTASLALHSVDENNLALWLAGEVGEVAAASGTVTDESAIAKPGQWIVLGADKDQLNAVEAAGFQVQRASNNDVIAETGNWTLDAANGRLYIISGGALSDGEKLKIKYTVAAPKRAQVKAGNLIQREVAVRYIEDDNDEGFDYFLPRVIVRPEGAAELKSRESEQVFTLTMNVLPRTTDGATVITTSRKAAA